ncbi:MAG: hypothetical protein KatS3mg023_2204 [Armatimonadota bacterium]|nr:MAG: hypothetical protein KatS3mg023_2204 [Armatimonadota bacterium]
MPATPACEVPQQARFRLEGWIGERPQANLNQGLLTAPIANPAMLQMFRDRDCQPRRALVPWAGEFAGKYLLSAAIAARLRLDFRLHAWLGEREQAGKVSLYRGPILLAYDQRFNAMDPDEVPTLSLSSLRYAEEQKTETPPPLLLLRFTGTDGRALRLCDFASAGAAGTVYRSWLPMRETALPEEMRSPFAV